MTEQIRKVESWENYNEAPKSADLSRSTKMAREAAKNQPEKVANKPANVNGENGMYEGGWKNDRPEGDGKFNSTDSVYVGKFIDGDFNKGTIENKKTGKKYNVEKNYGNYIGTCNQEGKTYKGKWDSKMNLLECDYKNVKIELKNNALVNKNGDTLPIPKGFDTGKTAMIVAAMINIVQYSGYDLDYFEAEHGDNGGVVQADYKNRMMDTDLLKNCKKLTGINSVDMVKWLNKSRRDFGI